MSMSLANILRVAPAQYDRVEETIRDVVAVARGRLKDVRETDKADFILMDLGHDAVAEFIGRTYQTYADAYGVVTGNNR